MKRRETKTNVFINCPFDSSYWRYFQAIVFTVMDCGCIARCALEAEDSGEVRILKIMRIIRECRLGIHDISRTELDTVNHLPRFNMPLELGMFLAAKEFGAGNQKLKSCLILDSEKYRYQKFISDIAGQDIKAHDNNIEKVVKAVRDWLFNNLTESKMPGGESIFNKYSRFQQLLPQLCQVAHLKEKELTFKDYHWLVHDWLATEKIAP